MNKPEKKEVISEEVPAMFGGANNTENLKIRIWNECCEAHDAWLPTVEELTAILKDEGYKQFKESGVGNPWIDYGKLAVAIAKRLGRENRI